MARLWVHESRPPRFFLVPPDQELPPGAQVVEDSTGERARVDLDQLAPHEVGLREARHWFEEHEEAIQAVREAREVQLVAEAEQLRAVSTQLDALVQHGALREQLASLGLDPQRLLSSPTGLEGLLRDLVDALPEDPETPDPQAGERVRKILRRHGHRGANRKLRKDPALLDQVVASLGEATGLLGEALQDNALRDWVEELEPGVAEVLGSED